MKKKLSLFLVALFALVAYAASTTWKVTADGATSIEAGTTLTDNDVLLAKTVYASNVVGGCTIGNEVFDNGFQVRVAAFPSGDDKTGTEQSGSTPVVITAKKDCDLTVYYRRQSTAQTENKGAYADNDGKDLIVYKQSDLSKLSGTLTIDHETDDGKYGWATKKVSLTAGETYTLCAKGTTIQFFGFTYETEEEQPAEASYYVVGTMNKWQASDEYKLATNAATEGEYMTTLQLAKDDELKVLKVEGDTETWYPDGMDNNLKVEVSGEYDIYFRPDGQGGQDWYNGYIYLALKDEPAVSYNVHLDDGQVNGTVEADKYEVAENEQVLLKVTPNENYEIDQVSVRTVTGAPIETRQIIGADYNYAFVMPGGDVYVSATFKELKEYTVQFVNGADWQQVYAYTWTGDGVTSEKVEQLGAWAGREMGLIDTEAEIDGKKYPVYELKFKAAVEPANIIFSDGTGGEAGVTQTEDLVFENNKQYQLIVKDEPQPEEKTLTIDFEKAATEYTDWTFTNITTKQTNSEVQAHAGDYFGTTDGKASGSIVTKEKIAKPLAIQFYISKLSTNTNANSNWLIEVSSDGTTWETVKTRAAASDITKGTWTEVSQDLSKYEDVYVRVSYDGTTANRTIDDLTLTYTDEGGGGDQPVEIKTMAIVGDFLGLEATGETNDPNWDPANGWEMTQSTDNPAIWTYVKEGFVAEAKKYEYKAVANGKWGDYELPAEGNQDFVFGTDMYPAGTYNLTFTANTSTHELTLDVAKDGISTVKELNALANGTKFKFLGNAIVVAKMEGESSQTIDNYIYIKDETGSSLIYDKGGAHSNESDKTKGLLVGDVITAPWNGTVSIYKNLFEVRPAGDEQLTASENVGEVTYPEATPDDVTAENVNKVVEIKGLTIYNVDGKNIKFTIGDDLVNGWNQFGIELPEVTEGKTFDVVGAISRYNDNIQFQPITITEAEGPQEFTVTFKTNLDWEPAYAYAWSGQGEQVETFMGDFPGEPMKKTETGEYTCTIYAQAAPEQIIFSNGKESEELEQTIDLPFENGRDYVFNVFTAGFETDREWKEVYAYTWTGDGETTQKIEHMGPRPGTKIEFDQETNAYLCEIPCYTEQAPEYIIFNNGTEAEVKEQTADLPFVDGMIYSLTTEKTTAWAGDPEEAIPATTGIEISATTCKDAGVQAEKIIRIVAKEIAVAAPARGLDNTVTGDPNDIPFSIFKADGETELIADKDITVAEDLGAAGKAYEFTATASVAEEITKDGFIIKPKTEKNVAVASIEVEQAKAPAAVVNIDFAPAPTDDIGAVIEARAAEITAAGNKVGNITITLGAIGTPYTTTKAIVAPAGVLIQGAGPATSIIDASGLEGDLITLNGTEALAQKKDGTDSDHKLIASVEVNNLKIAGLKGALITDAQKTLLEKLTINNAVVEMPAAAKNVINFNGKGYVGEVVVKNSTIYANGMNTGFFAQYGSRPKNVNEDWFQTFDVQNSTFVNIANTKNFTNLKQNGTDHNKYILKNNIFVDCGKTNQVVVGFNNGQTSATPIWDVDNNVFNASGADGSAAEVEKAGKKGEEDIVKNSVAGVVTFTDAANGDFNGTFALGEGASEPATKPGDPRWTITYATPVVITTMSIVGEFTGGWPVQDPETSAWDWSMAKAMTQDAENANIWTLEMPFVAEAKKYEYKAAANSNWNDYVLPLGDNANFIFGTDEYPAGEYILTFTADTKNHTVGVVAKWNGPEDIKVVPEEGADISTAVQTASEGKKVKDIYVYLAPGKKFTISKSIVAPAAFVFMGAAEGTNPSDIDENATMAEIDASALDGPMVLMSETPAVAADANGFYPLADVGFLNVKVTGLAQQLFYANKQKYLINCFHVDFCNINIAGGSKTIIDTNGGGVIATLDMSKNTIWANPENTGALYSSQSGDKATAAGLAVQTFNIEKNTMYNIAKGKNFCSHRQSNQTWLTYNVKNNTFVNCGKSGQVIKGLNGGSSGANPTWNVDGNAFNFDGADTSANEETGDADEPVKNSLAGVFTFTDATAGDFNGVFKSDAAEAPAKYPGDPRWTYTYESTAPAKFYLIGSMNNWDRTALTEMTFNETTQAYEYEYAPTEKVWFAFADKQLTADEAAADPEWADFNANHRYAIGSGDVNATLNEAIALQKINGTLVLEAGSYKISVAKDLSTVTITGEAPETTYTVAGSFYYAEGSVAIFGTEWDVANTANDMEKQLDGTYKKVYTIDFPFAGNIQFKVAENHAWDVSYGWDVTAENPDGNAFYNVASPANGATVTITFDPNGATAADKVKIEVTGIPTVGISGIATDDADDNAPIYNLAGQKVDKNYKGVVIKNGKKVYQK